MEMPETQQVEKNTYQIKNINGETFVIYVDNNDEKKFTKIAQITSDGDLIPQNITRVIGWSPNSLNISNEAEIKKNKVKTYSRWFVLFGNGHVYGNYVGSNYYGRCVR